MLGKDTIRRVHFRGPRPNWPPLVKNVTWFTGVPNWPLMFTNSLEIKVWFLGRGRCEERDTASWTEWLPNSVTALKSCQLNGKEIITKYPMVSFQRKSCFPVQTSGREVWPCFANGFDFFQSYRLLDLSSVHLSLHYADLSSMSGRVAQCLVN